MQEYTHVEPTILQEVLKKHLKLLLNVSILLSKTQHSKYYDDISWDFITRCLLQCWPALNFYQSYVDFPVLF